MMKVRQKVFKAPEPITEEFPTPTIFLAGSIEMGKAVDWQTEVTNRLMALGRSLYIFNPRRDDWDSSWEQKITNPKFHEQVSWELTAMERADTILMYFDSKTMSPITLLELGLHAQTHNKLVVCCPDGFWRKGNVDIVCETYDIRQVADIDGLVAEAKKDIEFILGDHP